MSNHTDSIRGRDRCLADHLPTCPRCHEVCENGASWCVECGAKLLPLDSYPDFRQRARATAAPGEVTQAREGSVS